MVACTEDEMSTSLSYPFLQIPFIDGEDEEEAGHVEDIIELESYTLKEKKRSSVVEKRLDIENFGLDIVEKASDDEVEKQIKEERVKIRLDDVEVEKSEGEEGQCKISLKPRLSSFTDQDEDQGDEVVIECACRQRRKISKSSTWCNSSSSIIRSPGHLSAKSESKMPVQKSSKTETKSPSVNSSTKSACLQVSRTGIGKSASSPRLRCFNFINEYDNHV